MFKNHTYSQFLNLLQLGLWNKKIDKTLLKDAIDWNAIINLSTEQSVLGIVGDGIANLPKELWPDQQVVFKWYSMTLNVEKRNERMNALLPCLMKLLEEKEVKCWLLKGQGLAQYYPKPLHRQPGDIDLLVKKEDFTKAMEVLKTLPHRKEESLLDLLHYDTNIDGVEVELHGSLNTKINSAANRHFNSWMDEMLFRATAVVYKVDGVNIPIPSANFNAVYVFIHLFRHYVFGGIGLRQVCDWMRLLAACQNEIDRKELQNTLERFHLVKAWKMFGCMAVRHLGMSEDAMPFYDGQYGSAADKILENIFENGNFGRNNKELHVRPTNYLHRKLHSFYYKTKDRLRHYSLFPEETIYALLMGWKVAIIYLLHGR